jgi:hypothetical protein
MNQHQSTQLCISCGVGVTSVLEDAQCFHLSIDCECAFVLAKLVEDANVIKGLTHSLVELTLEGLGGWILGEPVLNQCSIVFVMVAIAGL